MFFATEMSYHATPRPHLIFSQREGKKNCIAILQTMELDYVASTLAPFLAVYMKKLSEVIRIEIVKKLVNACCDKKTGITLIGSRTTNSKGSIGWQKFSSKSVEKIRD